MIVGLPIDVYSELHLDIVPDHVEALRHGPAMALTDDQLQVVALLTEHVQVEHGVLIIVVVLHHATFYKHLVMLVVDVYQLQIFSWPWVQFLRHVVPYEVQ